MLSLGTGRLSEAISSEEVLAVLVRPTSATGAERPGEGLRLRRLRQADATLYARAIGTDSPSTFATRLSRATRCYGVELDGRLVHASWVTTRCAWTRELRSLVCVGEGDAYVYESFTRGDARGRGVYPYALDQVCAVLAGEDVARLWVAVESHHDPSLRAVAKAGFERAFEISYERKLGKLTLHLPEGVKTDTHVTGGRKKRRIWLSGDGAGKQ